jgi:hypothetical protein
VFDSLCSWANADSVDLSGIRSQESCHFDALTNAHILEGLYSSADRVLQQASGRGDSRQSCIGLHSPALRSEPCYVGACVQQSRAGNLHLGAETGKECFEYLQSSRQQGVQVVALWNSRPGNRTRRQDIAVQYSHLGEIVSKSPRGEQAGDTGPYDDCLFATWMVGHFSFQLVITFYEFFPCDDP